jgi:hypothetical protein
MWARSARSCSVLDAALAAVELQHERGARAYMKPYPVRSNSARSHSARLAPAS